MDNRTLHAQIDMGNQADEFLRSELGQYIIGRCSQIIDNAKNDLTKVDPDRPEEIRSLQSTIWKAGAVPGFLNELLAEGRQALKTIQSTDDFVED
jgi:hypothetical protein